MKVKFEPLYAADDEGAAGAAVADDKPAGNDAPAAAAGDAGKGGSTPAPAAGDNSSKAGVSAVDNGPWGSDWREKTLANLDETTREKADKFLKTRSSPYDVLRSALAADSKITELTNSRVKIPTGKDDDPKDVAAYRKARGVPETPDKYDIEPFVKEVGELSPLDNELKDEFLKQAHSLNWGQKDVDFAMKTWVANQKMLAAEQTKRVLSAQQAAIDELRVEYGKEYRPNIELVNRMFSEELSRVGMQEADERREFLSKRFADGTALGEHPAFVKMMVNIARERADDGALVMGETADGGDIDKRIDSIMEKMNSDPKEYARMQPELQRLIAAQNRRNARGG